MIRKLRKRPSFRHRKYTKGEWRVSSQEKWSKCKVRLFPLTQEARVRLTKSTLFSGLWARLINHILRQSWIKMVWDKVTCQFANRKIIHFLCLSKTPVNSAITKNIYEFSRNASNNYRITISTATWTIAFTTWTMSRNQCSNLAQPKDLALSSTRIFNNSQGNRISSLTWSPTLSAWLTELIQILTSHFKTMIWQPTKTTRYILLAKVAKIWAIKVLYWLIIISNCSRQRSLDTPRPFTVPCNTVDCTAVATRGQLSAIRWPWVKTRMIWISRLDGNIKITKANQSSMWCQSSIWLTTLKRVLWQTAWSSLNTLPRKSKRRQQVIHWAKWWQKCRK